jgi:uncharacterized protein YcfJ
MVAMKNVALACTAVLTALALAGPHAALAQSRGRPIESSPRTAPPPSSTASGERGTVLSVTPIVEQVPVARRMCHDEAVAVRRQPSGAGALVGAIAGAAIGNAIGAGSGRAAATALGFVGGAALGDHAEAQDQPVQERTVRRCSVEHAYEDRTGAYRVVYEYGGREYTTVMRRDPGRHVQIQVQAVPEGDDMPPPRARRAPPPLSSREAPVYVERPVYRSDPEPVYYESYPPPPGYYVDRGPAPFGTGLVVGALIGYGLHYHGHRHHGRGWRR